MSMENSMKKEPARSAFRLKNKRESGVSSAEMPQEGSISPHSMSPTNSRMVVAHEAVEVAFVWLCLTAWLHQPSS